MFAAMEFNRVRVDETLGAPAKPVVKKAVAPTGNYVVGVSVDATFNNTFTNGGSDISVISNQTKAALANTFSADVTDFYVKKTTNNSYDYDNVLITFNLNYYQFKPDLPNTKKIVENVIGAVESGQFYGIPKAFSNVIAKVTQTESARIAANNAIIKSNAPVKSTTSTSSNPANVNLTYNGGVNPTESKYPGCDSSTFTGSLVCLFAPYTTGAGNGAQVAMPLAIVAGAVVLLVLLKR